MTSDNFANYLHKDRDFAPLAFGMWWSSTVTVNNRGMTSYAFDDSVGHNRVKGGQFILGEYGIGVDFERSA